MAAAKYIKLIAEAKKLLPRFARAKYDMGSYTDYVKVDGQEYEIDLFIHDGVASIFPKKKRGLVRIVATPIIKQPNGLETLAQNSVSLGYFKKASQVADNPKRCWKGYEAVVGKSAYSKGSCRKVRGNPVRTKTWKLGEYGGNIKANVNESGTAVQIIHSDKPLKAGAYGRLFRWPLDKFELETKLNDLTTSYYASKIIDWVQSVTKGTSMNPPPLFSKGGFVVVIKDADGETNISDPFLTKKEAEMYADRLYKSSADWDGTIEVMPLTRITKNPPLSSHGSSIRTKRTHGLSLAQMRALYKLVQRGNDMAVAYARKKLEVPRSASKSDLLAVVDHHIRDLADR